jgi:succinate dehydrogenase/fumarate reductase flavoprotein subunit
MTQRPDVIVVGAGFAGLAAAATGEDHHAATCRVSAGAENAGGFCGTLLATAGLERQPRHRFAAQGLACHGESARHGWDPDLFHDGRTGA